MVFNGKGGYRIRTCCSMTRPVGCDYLITRLITSFCSSVKWIISVLPFSPIYLTLYHLSPAVKKKHITLKFSRKQGDHVVYLNEKNKSFKLQTFAWKVHCKIATVASQHIITELNSVSNKTQLPLSFPENKGIMLYTLMRKTKDQVTN